MGEIKLIAVLLRYWKPLALFALILALVGFGYHWKAQKVAHAAEVAGLKAANKALALQVKQAAATERVVTKYVDRVKVVEGRTRTIVKEVPIYVPADSPALPGGFRLLHDAAALGILPDPAGIADAAPVPAQDAAATVADNYGTCQANDEQLKALQDWIRAQQRLR